MSQEFAGDRLAKVIARAGLCSRREAEDWIRDGRVSVNGKLIRTPAFNVSEKDKISVDGNPLSARQGTRVWLYHKPAGLVVTEKDPEGRETIFESLSEHGLPRVVSIGRLDINTEGLLLLTNDGGLKRVLELPATGWLRRYRVRAFGTITQAQLDALKGGIEVEGVNYGPIEAELERQQGSNVWLVIGLREGKNREVKNVLAAMGLQVNRLIRVSFGPFQLGDLPIGAVEVVRARVLREQLGKRLADEAGVDFESELPEPAAIKRVRDAANPRMRAAAPGKEPPRQRKRAGEFRFADRTDKPRDARPPRKDFNDDAPSGPRRRIFNPDGSTADFAEKTYGKRKFDRGAPAGAPSRGRGSRDAADKPRRDFGDRPNRDFGDRPNRDFGAKPKRSFGDRPPRDFGDRPKRSYAPRSEEGADRPKRSYAPRTESGARPPRDGGDRPKRAFFAPRGHGDSRPPHARTDHPKRDYGDKTKRSFAPRSNDGADHPSHARKPRGEGGVRPPRNNADRPLRDGVPPKRAFGDKPRSPRPAGDKPFGKRPRGSGPGGDRPRRPRPPRA
jgi:23S rRNA pseudouridine2605 synthase